MTTELDCNGCNSYKYPQITDRILLELICIIMSIVCIALWFAPLLIVTPIVIEESKKEQKINQMCLGKFNNPEDIKSCKAILMKMDLKR